MDNATNELVIDDVIYGKFTIPSDIAAIIATPLFQRLKSIKQLGFLDFKDNHKHNRYEHSIGTYHAATRMLDALEMNTPWFRRNKIPELYRKSVQIAALLHDVGQGPFSDAWKYIVPHYNHVNQSIHCVDAIFNQLDDELFPELRHNSGFGIQLIKALIMGSNTNVPGVKLTQKYQFLFEIVNHEFDVDKWDYLKRDHYYLKTPYKRDIKNFDKIFLKARVSQNGLHIEYSSEYKSKVIKYLRTLNKFQKNFYQSPQAVISESIYKLAIEQIQPKINNILYNKIYGKYSLSDFLHLTDDNLLSLIENSYYKQFLQANIKFEEVDNLPNGITELRIVLKKRLNMYNIRNMYFYDDNPKTKIILYTKISSN